MLRLLGGALFPGLFFLKAFKLPAAFFGLPFFAALGTGALPRFLWDLLRQAPDPVHPGRSRR